MRTVYSLLAAGCLALFAAPAVAQQGHAHVDIGRGGVNVQVHKPQFHNGRWWYRQNDHWMVHDNGRWVRHNDHFHRVEPRDHAHHRHGYRDYRRDYDGRYETGYRGRYDDRRFDGRYDGRYDRRFDNRHDHRDHDGFRDDRRGAYYGPRGYGYPSEGEIEGGNLGATIGGLIGGRDGAAFGGSLGAAIGREADD